MKSELAKEILTHREWMILTARYPSPRGRVAPRKMMAAAFGISIGRIKEIELSAVRKLLYSEKERGEA